MTQKFVAYYRVSTQKQGFSGLGLEAQEVAVMKHTRGGDVIATYTEVESGRKVERPQFARALRHAKAEQATLVVAKLDRLARNVAFIANLIESGVEFVCCDMPFAGRMELQIRAVFAEEEARQCSERTKAALAAAKARGVKLGANHPKFKRVGRRKAGNRLGGIGRHVVINEEFIATFWRLRKQRWNLHDIAVEMRRLGFGRLHPGRLGKRMKELLDPELKAEEVMEQVHRDLAEQHSGSQMAENFRCP